MKNTATILALCLTLSVLPRVIHAQEATARIIGTVTDPQGGTIEGARVTAANTSTGFTRETRSAKDGSYQILELPIGSYIIAAEQTGFSRTATNEQKLQINQALRLDISLKLGATSDTVSVEADAAGVETVNATLGQSVTSRPLVNMPLNGRNVLDLALLQPGVTETNPDSSATGGFSIAGGRTDSVTYLLDGGLDNSLLDNGSVYTPNPDTIAEFRILTSNYTAEYGRNGGGIVSIVTKSGTNAVHGSAFEFVRNDAFNASTFFNNEKGLPKPILKRNQFGATVGGPIKKDKFFFFVGYQSQRLVQTVSNPGVTVFTPGELKGDFSHSGPGGTPDPAVVGFLTTNPFFQPNPDLAALGIIAPGSINGVAQKYIAAGLIPSAPSGQILPQGSGKDNRDELTEKVDLVFTQNDRVAITLGSSRNPIQTPFLKDNNAGPNVLGFPFLRNDHRYFGNVGYTKVITPSLLNDARFTAQRFNRLNAVPAKKLPTPSQLGFGITPDNPTGPPLLGFASGLTTGNNPNGPTSLINNTYIYADTLTWSKGRHTVKAGGSFSAYQNNTVYDYYVNGEFFFYGQGGIGSGNDHADFLLGTPDEYLQFGQAPSNIRSKNYNGFLQDEWHVKRNLVLTLGMRYEYSTPKLDTQGRSFSIIPGLQSTRFVNAPVGLVFPGDKGAPKGANFPDKNDWAPRFGFAWDPRGNGKTSVRGGFGVFYDILKGEDNLQFNGQAPFFGFADLFFNPLSSNPTADVPYFSNPYPSAGVTNSFPSKPPAQNIDFGNSGFLPFGGGGVYFVNPHLRTPYIYQYNLSIQQELARNLVLEASYVGSDAHKLTALVDNNAFILGTSTRRLNTQPGLDAGTGYSYTQTFENVGKQNYNSLQASLQKRLSDSWIGTTYFTLAYTLGHNIDNSSGFRQRSGQVPYYNHDLFRASADTDVRHRVVFSGGWDLPFDRAWSSGPHFLTRGWSLYPIANYRTGFPLDVGSGYNVSRSKPGPSGAGDQNLVRANLVGGKVTIVNPKNAQTLGGNQGNYYFNPANFDYTSLTNDSGYIPTGSQRTYGSLPRNAFRGPGRVNFDLALAKNTPIFGEHLKSEFRAEFFNILNHTEFSNPDTNIRGATFGQITTTADPRIIQLALRLVF